MTPSKFGGGRLIDIAGCRFGKWTVVAASHRKHGKTFWTCRCDCGVVAVVNGRHLRGGESTQCRGCAHSTHGATRGSRRTEHAIWAGMIARCFNAKCRAYPRYGGRGITVCLAWKTSFSQFFADMGERPNGKTLDRIDNDGNYEPSNCRWATWKQQAANRRRPKRITNGPSLSASMESQP